ncbi:UvrB/UvrC motif-containing protein, partial [Tetragenococcus halophilus]
SERSLVQTMGRAARNADGEVVMYADKVTDSMQNAIDETTRRRKIQEAYNEEHGIVPQTVKKDVRDLISISSVTEEGEEKQVSYEDLTKDEKEDLIEKLNIEMKEAAKSQDFEKAANLRDSILELKA